MRLFLIVLDGVGIGALPDAADYGDQGSNTLLHVAQAIGGLRVPQLEGLGLGNLMVLPGVRRVADASGAWGRMAERSAGKDSTTGHWELMGLQLLDPFPTYPDGFPSKLLDEFSHRVGRGWLGNRAASGTEIIETLGQQHQKSGDLIVYTSADSVFQVAAHVATVPLEELYEICRTARSMLVGPHAVGRVIARPFTGEPGGYVRTSDRRDFSLEPPRPTVLDRLMSSGVRTVTVGKVDDLFANRGVQDAIHTRDNSEGQSVLMDLAARSGEGFVFANLVDFDTRYGHRNDPAGFGHALHEFDEFLGRLLSRLRSDEWLMLTADHGNDPTTPGTDHSREYVPVLAAGPGVRRGTDLGTRTTFADVGATVADLFSVPRPESGTSMLRELRS